MRHEFSKATKLAAWEHAQGRCEQCTAELFSGNVEYHHAKECTYGGNADLGNCICLCRGCHRLHTGERASVIAKSNRVRNRHIGIKRPVGFRGWRRFDGSVVRR